MNVYTVAFSFDSIWDGLDRTAVFQAGDSKISVILDDTNQCQIPWEVLENPRRTLGVGVYGTRNGTVVLPTVWASLGEIKQGVSLGDNNQPPTPDVYGQILQAAKDAEDIAQGVRDDADSGKFDGEVGPIGPQGYTYTPAVSEEGVISWANDGNLPNPDPVNIIGRQGQPGETPDITVGTVETLDPDQDATANITGKTPNLTLNLGIPKGQHGQDAPQIDDTKVTSANPWSSLKIVDTLAPPFSSSGAIVTCNPVPGYPLHVISQIEPVQEGTGDPSPENVRPITGWTEVTLRVCGKNLVQISERTEEIATGLIIDWHSDGRVTISGSPTEPTGYLLNKTDSLVLPAGSYYISQNPPSKDWFRFLYRGSYYMGRALEANGINPILMAVRKVPAGDIPAETAYPMLTVGSTPPDQYEPPNPNAFTITLPLGQTVYGGTLDWQTGVLTVTHGEIASYAGESLPGAWMSDRDVYSAGSTPTTGAQVVYELATPNTIQLTPHEVLALAGENTIYGNTGDVTVSGRADPNTIIQSLSQRIAALESAAVQTQTGG